MLYLYICQKPNNSNLFKGYGPESPGGAGGRGGGELMDCIPYDIQVPKYYALAITIYHNCNLDLAVTTVFST